MHKPMLASSRLETLKSLLQKVRSLWLDALRATWFFLLHNLSVNKHCPLF
ncbi:hypothetical protein HETIRDRAFT_326376 [Heterobasidion irregulare TC 32-1]|uniref:Uncharacterized protein n=1 Tax=Heterobasidion irregulare (strain TC 32-1) TaxID=747525 RepID=W4JX29_HETIT|nr:uncharacterized protein HETIRDRAFT_326376 [Heterobasidion irregulare TC 32-1]ETW78117.1 hypothetical protein HETIRDRAFT_326376 [Heterobasidion irregulare TC 32-1]